jgi:hypothetical protein
MTTLSKNPTLYSLLRIRTKIKFPEGYSIYAKNKRIWCQTPLGIIESDFPLTREGTIQALNCRKTYLKALK